MLTRRLPRLFTRRFGTAAQSAVKHATPRITASILPSLASYPATRITTLPNGLRVATEKSSGETGTVGVWVDTGSRYEDQKSNGVAHFLEHLVFKGTQRRSRRQLEMEVEQVGGHLNAYTSREQTVFYAKAFKNDIPQAMDILADILQNSKFEGDAVERERDTILREMKEVDEQMEEVLFDRLHETAYRGSPLSYTILGPVENIKSITREHILDYINTHYTADRMVIAGAGAVNHDQLVELTQKLFANVPRKPAKKVTLQPAKFIGSDIRVRDDSIENAHVALAFEVAGWDDPDNFPLMLIQTMLGAWDKASSGGSHSSSPLVATLAKDKLAESMVPFNTLYSDTGLFGVHIVAPPEGLTEMMKTVLNEFVGLCYHVEEHRLNEAKNQLKMNVLAQLDGSTVICEEIGRHMLTYGRRMHPLEAIQRIDAVDANAIKAAANRFFYDRDFALAAIGQIYELPDYNWIRSRTFWRRV